VAEMVRPHKIYLGGTVARILCNTHFCMQDLAQCHILHTPRNGKSLAHNNLHNGTPLAMGMGVQANGTP
jgi:hypothetical protein